MLRCVSGAVPFLAGLVSLQMPTLLFSPSKGWFLEGSQPGQSAVPRAGEQEVTGRRNDSVHFQWNLN